MLNYSQAKAILATARNPAEGKPFGNNTRIIEHPDGVALLLHRTCVLVYRPDGSVIYNSGGWHTVTTKSRMNAHGPLGIYSKNRIWYFADGTKFYDGARVDYQNHVVPKGSDWR